MKKYWVLGIICFVVGTICAGVQVAYIKGFTDGVHRTEQCHAQYGVMKADYEEHFICMY